MADNVVRFADATTMPWLGGGGVTHELARKPAEGDFAWRLSVAEVQQDGAFSRLDGIDRVIVLCSPGRMVLHLPDSVRLERFSPYKFDGGVEVSCTVPDGPTRDFNVMTRRGRYVGDVATVTWDSTAVTVPTGAEAFVVCLDGTVRCDEELGAFDLVRLAGGGDVTVDAGSGVAAIVTLTAVPEG